MVMAIAGVVTLAMACPHLQSFEWGQTNKQARKARHRFATQLTSTTKVVLEAQWGICPALCVLRQYKFVFA